jgi:hypothetical protein
MGGYGWSDTVRASIGGLAVSASSSDLKGGFAGGTVGYNYQMGSLRIPTKSPGYNGMMSPGIPE